MPSVLIAILMLAGLALAVLTREAHAEPAGDLYAFCDAEWKEPCATKALMLKDVCEDTIRTYGDDQWERFWCARVDAATRDAYLGMVEPDVRENTFRAWREGR